LSGDEALIGLKGTMKSSRCDHLGIFTNNSRRLAEFYQEKLGFEKEKEEIVSHSVMVSIFGLASDCRLVRLVLGTVKIEIFHPLALHLQGRSGKPVRAYKNSK
jgi:hypothetical protein